MAEGKEDTHMEGTVDEEMDDAGPGMIRRVGRDSFHGEALLAPDTDFIIDDRSSGASGMDVADRLTYLEQRIQMQEDEIQLLKMALADVLKRLNISEEQQASLGRKGPVKARPVSLALPSRSMSSSNSSLRKSTTLPPNITSRNANPSAATKSAVKSSSGVVQKEGGVGSKGHTRTAASTSVCKKALDSKDRELGATAGTRRVTHCKDLSEPPVKKDWIF